MENKKSYFLFDVGMIMIIYGFILFCLSISQIISVIFVDSFYMVKIDSEPYRLSDEESVYKKYKNPTLLPNETVSFRFLK